MNSRIARWATATTTRGRPSLPLHTSTGVVVIPQSCDQTSGRASALATERCCGRSRTDLVTVE